MLEILEIAFSNANIIATTFLGLTLVYWISLILGALDLGFLDFDLEPDYEADVHMDVDFDANAEVDASGDVSGGARLLWFFNIGKVPFMVFFTFWIIPTWFLCIIGSYYINPASFWIVGLLIFGAALFGSLFIAKILTQPLVKIFQKMEKIETKNEDLIGKYCITKWDLNDNKIGQVVLSFDGSEYVVNALATNSKTIPRNGQGLIIDYDKENDLYIVEPHESV